MVGALKLPSTFLLKGTATICSITTPPTCLPPPDCSQIDITLMYIWSSRTFFCVLNNIPDVAVEFVCFSLEPFTFWLFYVSLLQQAGMDSWYPVADVEKSCKSCNSRMDMLNISDLTLLNQGRNSISWGSGGRLMASSPGGWAMPWRQCGEARMRRWLHPEECPLTDGRWNVWGNIRVRETSVTPSSCWRKQ